MALSAAEMQEAVIKNLPEKTGKNLNEWIEIAKSFDLTKNKEIITKLKAEYGLGHVQAQTITWRMNGEKPYVETNGYEENIFKQHFSQYERIKKHILKLDAGIKAKPCKTYIPFYRKKQFAILTEKKGDLILGLCLEKDDYPELASATKIGGSDRVNKMLVVNTENIDAIEHYIKTALENN